MDSSIKAWFLAARPKTLVAALSPVCMGGALAWSNGHFLGVYFALALVSAVFIQIGTNFCNDYFDHRQGADTAERQGPARAVQSGWISPQAMWRATLLTFGLAGLSAVLLVMRGGWPLAVVAVLSIGCGIWYTAGRYSLAYLGIGDVFVAVFFGPVAVGGTYFAQALSLPTSVIVAGLAPGLISTGLLAINNLRDADQDRAANKRTLAVRFGRMACRVEYLAVVIGAALIPFILWRGFGFGPKVLVASLVLPLAIPVFRVVLKADSGRELNPMLGKTAGLLVAYTVLFCVGVLW